MARRQRNAAKQNLQADQRKSRSARRTSKNGTSTTTASRIKKSAQDALAELYIIVDEKANEYELTDKGIHAWAETGKAYCNDDFIMLDLGHEYAQDRSKRCTSMNKKSCSKKSLCAKKTAKRKERAHNLRQMLRAHLLMEKDVDYIVAEGKIVIIDENTGRPQPGRRFSDGLHQAIEAKEGVAIQGETQTYATITLQNYFRMYAETRRHDRNGDDRGERIQRDLQARSPRDPHSPHLHQRVMPMTNLHDRAGKIQRDPQRDPRDPRTRDARS